MLHMMKFKANKRHQNAALRLDETSTQQVARRLGGR